MPPTETLHAAARNRRPELEQTEPGKPTTFRLGVLTDADGHVHVGAIAAGHTGDPCTFVDLLAAVRVDELYLARVLILSAQQVAQLRHNVAKRCVEDNRLRLQLVELIDLTEYPRGGRP